ncbi:serine/threonine-protein kinase LMTK1 [Chanos chanos]|uniref:non-specific serine/threonine protein kinase n=1 Tax=Chanos chanos TaxID=29144 RepID=A0A6J2VEQ7_CHACN|nr:serine/threonine-protein kinase LMTK1-like [Chanos chanos]
MSARLVMIIMSSSFFNPSFALSSHFDTDGAPLSELSWSSSLAVVAVSFSGLFTFIFLMLTCLCCKKGGIGFKEFENAEGEEQEAGQSALGSPASQGGPDVYILPLTELSLPVAKQPGRSVQLLRSTDVSRHSLLYLKEIGHGWFGKVLLGELNAGLSSTQVVVKELKASASVQDQMHFLEEAQPYRSLQHPALLQCLAQSTEVTPNLLVMEFCPLGDVKGYLRSCRASDSLTPDPLLLQRMACEIASGLMHLHKHNFTHSDLALRNCLITSDVTVKIGDYGLSHSKYRDDYFVTSDQTWVPLRWIAPELVDEVHGNLLIADQTKQSNIWTLGVTIWELFELGSQPYRHYSDRQVLTYAVKDQQLKLQRPLLKVPLADRWYEVMQFCWLQPDQRPNAEEVHLLLSYLCAKGVSEAEEDFERRWNSMRPNTRHGSLALEVPQSSSSSFPLLEQFSMGDGYHSESGDDILTVTETSHGLNFEYKWEQARAEQPYHSSSTSGTLGQGNPHCQEIYYPPGSVMGGCGVEGLTLGVSPSYYDHKQLHAPGVVPVLSAHSPSVSSEYYIRIEEPIDCNIDLDYTMCTYSPDFEGSNGSFLTGSGDSGECMDCPSDGKPIDSYWSANVHKSSIYDSDTSPAMSLTMEPLLGQVSDASPLRPWESGHYVSYKDRDGGYYYEHSPPSGVEHYIMGDQPEPPQESWGSRSLRQALGELENPLGISPSLSSPPQVYGDPYLESNQGSIIGKDVAGGYYDMMGSLRKTMPGSHSVCINMEPEAALFIGREESDSEEEDLFAERQGRTWPRNHSANNNSLSLCRRQRSCRQDAYVDFHYTMPMTDVEDSWPENPSRRYHSTKAFDYLKATSKNNTCIVHGKHATLPPVAQCNSYIHLCGEARQDELSFQCYKALDGAQFVDPLTGSVVKNHFMKDYVTEKNIGFPNRDQQGSQAPLPVGHIASKSELSNSNLSKDDKSKQYVDIAVNTVGDVVSKNEDETQEDTVQIDAKTEANAIICLLEKPCPTLPPLPTEPEVSKTLDSGLDRSRSSISLVDIDDCSDDDITDITSGIFGDFNRGETETTNFPTPTFKSLQKQVGTPDSVDSIDLPSTAGSSETSSASFHPSSSPKAMDSGYDTENNESPEFVLKEPHEPQDAKVFIQPLGKNTSGTSSDIGEPKGSTVMTEPEQEQADVDAVVSLTTSQSRDGVIAPLSEGSPYRDSAYFSDYDTENERLPLEEVKEREGKEESEKNFTELEEEKKGERNIIDKEVILFPQVQRQGEEQVRELSLVPKEDKNVHQKIEDLDDPEGAAERVFPIPILVATPSATSSVIDKCQMTKEESQDEGLEADSDHSMKIELSECLQPEMNTMSSKDVTSGTKEQEPTDRSLCSPTASVSFSQDRVVEIIPGVSIQEADGSQNIETEGESSETTGHLEQKEEVDEKGREVGGTKDDKSSDTGKLETQEKDFGEPRANPMLSRSSSPPPLPPPEGRVSPDGGDADEEDGDSEDSDESDEELRTYSVQEQSDESDEEILTVPIIVSDCSDAHKLRSLLKMPTLITDSLCDELESKKKVVSFFDDVTVYLFDQESPTRELAEQGFPLGAESNKQGTKGTEPHPQEKINMSDDSSDGNISEESAGFEWEDDFPLLPTPPSVTASTPDATAKTSVSSDTTAVAQYSRFTVSPSSVSRFSITHVSDSDMDSAGGSSEDGEKE